MRKEFSTWIENFGKENSRVVFLTGDLGFAALENVQGALTRRFINMGVCEQNMVSVAAGLAHQGLIPVCYSIAPFAVFRPYEQIRLDVALHNLPVKIVGNGGGYGYGIMGASHHALEDLAVLSCLPNFSCIVPVSNHDVPGACEALFQHDGPGYLRLGFGLWPEGGISLPDFAPVRQLIASEKEPTHLTVVGIGPVLLNTLPWIAKGGNIDMFVVSKLPLVEPPRVLIESVRASRRLLVIEEHAARGGLAEYLAAALAQQGVCFELAHKHAAGYPRGRYGSQAYHQKQSGLDAASLQVAVSELFAR